ncbi:unnamed protein product [Angiostrongylus costaricensis]|uniref:ADF-H domain-containing protein n=1 Tax=Angiostrongylus costaricensis TaxID=334426 RepID=A0A0R3P9K4_ANGCS|nr:unnamed protein product [Angiostrongylus costaricensis]
MNLAMHIDSFEQLTTRIGCLPLKRCGSTPALRILVVYASTSIHGKEQDEAFYIATRIGVKRCELIHYILDEPTRDVALFPIDGKMTFRRISPSSEDGKVKLGAIYEAETSNQTEKTLDQDFNQVENKIAPCRFQGFL